MDTQICHRETGEKMIHKTGLGSLFLLGLAGSCPLLGLAGAMVLSCGGVGGLKWCRVLLFNDDDDVRMICLP